MDNKAFNIRPADRLGAVNEYYFSTKGKEVAQMNAEGKGAIYTKYIPRIKITGYIRSIYRVW